MLQGLVFLGRLVKESEGGKIWSMYVGCDLWFTMMMLMMIIDNRFSGFLWFSVEGFLEAFDVL